MPVALNPVGTPDPFREATMIPSPRLLLIASTLLIAGELLAAPKDRAALDRTNATMAEQFARGDYREAESLLLGILEACAEGCSDPVKAQIWVAVGVVRLKRLPKPDLGLEAFRFALALDPEVVPDRGHADGRATRLFWETRAQLEQGARGPTTPPAPGTASRQGPSEAALAANPSQQHPLAAAPPTTPAGASSFASSPASTSVPDPSPMVGTEVIVSWTGGGMVGRLVAVDESTLTLVTADGQAHAIGRDGVHEVRPSQAEPAPGEPSAPGAARYPDGYGVGGIVVGSVLGGLAVTAAASTTLFFDEEDGPFDDDDLPFLITVWSVSGVLLGAATVPFFIGLNRRPWAGKPMVAGTFSPVRGGCVGTATLHF